jgi:hypothetical protein
VTVSSTNCHGNPQCASRVVLCGCTDGRADRQTDMAKLIMQLFSNKPENDKAEEIKN